MKKKTQTEKLIDKVAKATASKMHPKIVSHCDFHQEIHIGDAAETVAQALLENAKSLGILASVISHTNATCMTIK